MWSMPARTEDLKNKQKTHCKTEQYDAAEELGITMDQESFFRLSIEVKVMEMLTGWNGSSRWVQGSLCLPVPNFLVFAK